MATTKPRRRRARGSLSPEEILAGAYDLVAEEGLDDLSMPVLARRLGAGVTSIYWYFRNKEELLVALSERVTEDVFAALPPIGDGPWDDELRTYLLEYRQVLQRFPVYNELSSLRPRFVVTRPRVFPVVMRRLDEEVGVLVRAGLSVTGAAHAVAACTNFVRGYVLLEQGLLHEPEELGDDVHERLVQTVTQLDPGAFPTLTALGDIEPVTTLDDADFERGVELLLDGIRGQVDGQPSSPRRGRRLRRTP